MSTSETIANLLLKKNCKQITFGAMPDGGIYIQLMQGVITGTDGNGVSVSHQQCNDDIPVMLERLKKNVDHCEQMSTVIVSLKGRGNGGN